MTKLDINSLVREGSSIFGLIYFNTTSNVQLAKYI